MKQIFIGNGHYSLREPLGSGGMAEVFLARDEVLGRDVALKILKEQYADNVGFVERFRREARSAASLNHPRIIVVYDWGRSADGTYCMAMEYASGGTLKDRILEDGPLPPRKAAKVASQIAEGLGFAHERGVIHRDVKPQNVLLTEAGDAKVADFGIAQAASATTTSRSNLILGTANYMSPEQAKGGRVSPASDLYSLGVVLYEMLTGELPYKADSPLAAAVRHFAEPPRSPREANPEVPEVLEVLTLRLLAKDPTDRYGSAAEVLEVLRQVRDGLPTAFTDAGPVAANRAVLPAPPVPTAAGEDGRRGRPYVVYGGRSSNLPLALAGAFLALLVLLGAAVWGPWWGSQELAQAQDVARGALDRPGEASDEDERAAGLKEVPEAGDLSEDEDQEGLKAVSEAGDLPEDEGQEGLGANTGSPKLGNLGLASSEATSQGDINDQDPEAGIPAELGSEDNVALGPKPERVRVPEVRGGSTEEASQALSASGHVVAGTAKRHNPKPSGTVIGTNPAVGSPVERGTAITILLSSGPASQEDSNGGEDEAEVTMEEETTVTTQSSKTRKRNQKSSTAVFVKAELAK
jgi:eukaryotic-like serine/threonine-protein kinase